MESRIAISPKSPQVLLDYIQKQCGQNVLHCYQCGKCTAGCPSAYLMDLTPRQIMRAVQLGLQEDILKSNAIWICLSCQTCSVRCPRQIEVAGVIESLRLLAIVSKKEAAEPEVKLFHNIFVNLISRYGRIYEFGLAGAYNVLSRHLFTNIALLPGMVARGKLAFLPPNIKGAREVKKIFARVNEADKAARA